MTAKQTALYWRMWAAVCSEFGWKNSDSERRHALHVQAGCPESMTKFNNNSFDRFLAFVRSLLGQKNGGLDKSEVDGERKRLVWRIKADAKKGGIDDAYIVKVSRDLNVLGNWEDLALDDLKNLRDTIHNRAGKKIGRDTRTKPRRQYVLDAVPRKFVSRELMPF